MMRIHAPTLTEAPATATIHRRVVIRGSRMAETPGKCRDWITFCAPLPGPRPEWQIRTLVETWRSAPSERIGGS